MRESAGNQSPYDALMPPAMAEAAETIGVRKAGIDIARLFTLAFLGGSFIALGAVFSTTVGAGGSALPFGLVRLMMGVAFSLGLILIVVGGAELFTGNMLLVMAWASRRVSTALLMRNWSVVYAGNFCGAVATAWLVQLSGYSMFGAGTTGALALGIAEAKLSHGFVQAIALGALCNVLVCLAVWLTISARSTADRVLVIVPPITAFVTCGFEHSVANMYFVPAALFLKNSSPPEFWTQIGHSVSDFDGITWQHFLLANLLPVTIGNVVGGAVMVAAVYWLVYRFKH